MAKKEIKQPIKKFRRGDVTGSVWENEKDGEKFYSVSIARNYKQDDEWKSTNSFSLLSLPRLVSVANLCHEWIYDHRQESEE